MRAVGMYYWVTFPFLSHLAFHSSSGTESFTGDSEKPASKIQKLCRTDDHEDSGSPQRLPQGGELALWPSANRAGWKKVGPKMKFHAYVSFPFNLAWVVWSKIPPADIRAEKPHI